MDNCLSIFLTGKYPSGQSLRTEPFVVEAQPTQKTMAGGDPSLARTPIPTSAGAAPITYYKRTLRVFDVAKQSLIWEKRIMVKTPSDLQESLLSIWMAHEATNALEQSGLLP